MFIRFFSFVLLLNIVSPIWAFQQKNQNLSLEFIKQDSILKKYFKYPWIYKGFYPINKLNAQILAKDCMRNGKELFKNNQVNNSLPFYVAAKYLFIQINDTSALSQSFYHIGKVYAHLNKIQIAIKHMQFAMHYDSLTASNNDSLKVAMMRDLALLYKKTGDFENVSRLIDASIRISLEKNFQIQLIDLYNLLGNVKTELVEFDSARYYLDKALTLSKNLVDTNMIGTALLNMGINDETQGYYKEAIKKYLKALYYFEKSKNINQIANTYNSLGISYFFLGDYIQSLYYYEKSLALFKIQNNISDLAYAYNNIGIIYGMFDDTVKEIAYYKRALENHKITNNKNGIADVYSNLGETYLQGNQYEYAGNCFFKAQKIFREMNDINGQLFCENYLSNMYFKSNNLVLAEKHINIALNLLAQYEDLSSKAWINTRMATIRYKQGRYKEALTYAITGYNAGLQSDEKDILKHAAHVLSDIYSRLNDYKSAYTYHTIYKKYSDRLINYENIKILSQQEYTHRLKEEKQKQELLMKQEELAHEKELAIQNNIKTSLIIIVFATLLMSAIIFINLQRKRKLNNKLKTQQAEILEINEELIQLNHELNLQKEEIFKTNINITDSIRYAKKIQTALLPNQEVLHNIFPDSFIFFRPLQIVSGDFFWIKARGEKVFLAVADCTGHGVPGAFMSVLGIAYLNEIFRTNKEYKANEILTILRQEIKESLGQKGINFETNDGMDIAFCIIDKNTLLLEFAGAYNNLLHISDGILTVYKGDKQPIAIYDEEKPFTNYEIQLKHNDTLYLLTDGYVDQFGGESGRKLLMKNFQKLLLSHSQIKMEIQEQIFSQTLDNWMSNKYAQVDDITLVGIRV